MCVLVCVIIFDWMQDTVNFTSLCAAPTIRKRKCLGDYGSAWKGWHEAPSCGCSKKGRKVAIFFWSSSLQSHFGLRHPLSHYGLAEGLWLSPEAVMVTRKEKFYGEAGGPSLRITVELK